MIWFILVGLGLLILLVRTFFFLVDVQGGSMIPALEHGDRVLALRVFPGWQRLLKKGKIVVLHFQRDAEEANVRPSGKEGTLYIKRLIGLPGETVALYPTDLPPLPPYLSKRQGAQQDAEGTWHWLIPLEHGFVKGDSWGFDSTLVGPIPLRNVRGMVVMKLRAHRAYLRPERPLDWPSDLQQE